MSAATQARRRDPTLEIVASSEARRQLLRLRHPLRGGGRGGGGGRGPHRPDATAVPRRAHRSPPPPRGHRHRPRRRQGRGAQPRVPADLHDRLRPAPRRHRGPSAAAGSPRHRPAVRARRPDARRRGPPAGPRPGRRHAVGWWWSAAATSASRWPRPSSTGAPRGDRRGLRRGDGHPRPRPGHSSARPSPYGVDLRTGTAVEGFEDGAVPPPAAHRRPPTSWCSASASRRTWSWPWRPASGSATRRWRSTPASAPATRRLGRRRLLRVVPPRVPPPGPHRPRHRRQQAGQRWPASTRWWASLLPGRQSAPPSPRCAPPRSPAPGSTSARPGRRSRLRLRHDRVEDSGRLLPGAKPITVKLLAEPGSGRLLGAQLVGEEGAGKRIDAGRRPPGRVHRPGPARRRPRLRAALRAAVGSAWRWPPPGAEGDLTDLET